MGDRRCEKEVFDVYDIMDIFQCSKTMAQRRKREIKAISDITKNARTVHRIDYENYLEFYRLRKQNKEA